MPITADLGGKNYTLGKGKVFFDRYANNVVMAATTQGEGERYFGNTPEFSTSSSSENLDHYSSEGGIRVKDDSAQLQLDRTGKFTSDNISSDNVALMFLGDASVVAQTAQTGLITLVTAAQQGRFYQLGVSASNPSGLRNVKNLVVKKGAGFITTITASGNYQFDAELGRLYIEAAAPDITNGTDLQITFDTDASTRDQVVSGTDSIYGALRFVSDNPKGSNRDYYFPYVKLAPDGDYALKGEEWMTMGFTFEILKKADNIESAYIDGRPTVTP